MVASELPAVAPLEKKNASISDRTLHAILSMAGREVAIKMLALVGWVVLARLLEPEVFGLFAVASFAINLFILFSEVGLGASLVRARGELHPRELSALFTYQLVWFAIPALALFLAAYGFSGGRGMADLSLVLQALAVSFVIISMRTVPSILSQRRLAYGPIVVADVSAQAAFWLVAVGLSLAHLGAWSVVCAVIAFSVVGTGVLYARTGWRPSMEFDWRGMGGKARFSLMFQGQSAASFAKYAMLPTLGGLAYGQVGVGYVTWAHQIAVVPALLTLLIARVSYPALARLQDEPDAFAGMLISIVKWTCKLTFPVCAVMLALAPQLINYVYGAKWLPALPSFYLLTANTAILLPTSVLVPALYSLGRGTEAFRILAGMAALTWVAAGVLVALGVGLEALAIGFMVGTLFAVVATLYEARKLFRVPGSPRSTGLLTLPAALPAATGVVMGAAVYLLAPFLVHGLPSLFALGLVSGTAMLAANLWGDYQGLFATVRAIVGAGVHRLKLQG